MGQTPTPEPSTDSADPGPNPGPNPATNPITNPAPEPAPKAAPDPLQVFADAVPRVQCSICGYSFEGLDTLTCPECGTVMTPEEMRLGERRRVYLDLTRWHAFKHVPLLMLTAAFTYGVLLLPYALALLSVLALPRRRGEVARVMRRVWLLSLVWIYPPWLLGVVAFYAWDYLWYHPYYSIGEFLGALGGLTWGGLLVGHFVFSWIWYWRLRVQARAAGLTGKQVRAAFPIRGPAARIAIGPAVVILLLVVVPSVMVSTLDALFPAWEAWFEW